VLQPVGTYKIAVCKYEAVQSFDIRIDDFAWKYECLHRWSWGPPLMKANELIRSRSASFGPQALKVIGQAFDEAWAEIAANFGNDPPDVERARLRLAYAMLSVADEDSRDAQLLKKSRAASNGAWIPQSPSARSRLIMTLVSL
jgi:hypothetical protein